ncbi:hypothetical protein ACQKP0_09140 [Heyndrickxia sp. NPDC080065]|uniref:hypothetical protein n=1 Tax=Heyndrickxia sp. NPDC080065 TaxID=3390568 RepID=UPI003D08C058
MDKLKIIIKSLFWVIITQVIIFSTLYFLGFRITYAPNLETSWNAVAAIGQWAGALVGVLIPIAAVYLQAKLDKNKREIGESNSDLLNELKEFKLEYSEKLKTLSELVDEKGNIVINSGYFTDDSKNNLKEKALKFVNISMITKTKRVAEHLEISHDKAYDLLVEMAIHDGSISSAGQIRKENMDNIVWTKKTR